MKHLKRLIALLLGVYGIMLGFMIVTQGVGDGTYQVDPTTIMLFLLVLIYEFKLSM